ncbi:MAG: tetratricopeptide repeat protein [Aggregatilineaceae bacterium]
MNLMNDFGLWFQAIKNSNDLVLLKTLLFGNALLSAVVATITIGFLPYRETRQRVLLWMLIGVTGLFISLLGSLGTAIAMLAGMRRKTAVTEPFHPLNIPEFNTISHKKDSPFVRGSLRVRVMQSNIPVEQRLQSITTLQNLPPVVTSPILRTLLDDPVEDIRLIAFDILDKKEKKIAARIHELLRQPEPTSATRRSQREKQLAELYWELAYSWLVQGDLRRYILENALTHAKAAMELKGHSAGLYFLIGRILHALGRSEEAKRNIQLALDLGMPKHRVLPYLAEFAFQRREFRQVRQMLNAMRDAPITPRLRPVLDYWVNRETHDR